jgi:hypothetical protein
VSVSVDSTLRDERYTHTYPALTVAFVNAEHRYVSTQVAVPVRRLLAHYDADGMRDAMGICLCSYTLVTSLHARRSFSYEERKVGPMGGRRVSVCAWRCGVKR